ncbi:cytochrome P450 [Tanacetum coccineum]|uniref:Cytochrome P450 n=1 Tax=Tanacetum coccineum TaxID=301880 RepID=A0ABQ5A7G9_9ASTR
MHQIFAKYGTVEDVFITRKRNMKGKRFGFSRFANVKNPVEFEKRLNSICIGTQKVRCNIARFQRGSSKTYEGNKNNAQHHPQFSQAAEVGSKLPRTTYATVLTDHKQHPKDPPKHIINVQPPNPPTLSQQQTKTLIVAEIKSINGATNIHNFLLDEGFDDFTIKYLGGLTLLLNFPDTTSTAKALINTTLLTLFKSLKPWTNDLHIKERATWLGISGLPPLLWTSETFSTIAKQWGDVIIPEDCNPRQFNRTTGKVLILTKQLELIHTTSYIPFGKDFIPVRIFETNGEIDSLFNGYSLDSSSDDEEEDAPEMDDNSSVEPLVVGNNEGEWSDDDKDDPNNEPTLAAGTNSTTNSGGNTFSEKTGKYIPSGVLADTIREVGSTSTHVHKVNDKIQNILSDSIHTSTPDILVSVSGDTSSNDSFLVAF